MKKFCFFTASFFLSISLWAQVEVQEIEESKLKNWYLQDVTTGSYPGVGADRVYAELLADKEADTVIVAIIDSGMEPTHDGLKPVMWVNPGEIPGNGIDDDGNGYIDDVYGWNFIGGKDGKNIGADTFEVTRLFVKLDKKFKDVDPKSLSKKEKKEYEQYLVYKTEINKQRTQAKAGMNQFNAIVESLEALGEQFEDGRPFTIENIENIDATGDEVLFLGKNIASQIMNSIPLEITTFGEFYDLIADQFEGTKKYFKKQLETGYNTDFDERHIVGDNYDDVYERYYGNSDVQGPDAQHGTHVGGIVGAKAHAGDDIYGVARHVKLMSVRAVPDGDERDKDVANAIIYAVDNGASIINMSFGKGYSWNKQVVDEAVKYAAANDVLLVHAAGNSGQNNDVTDNFPNAYFEKRGLFQPKRAKNWIEVGALAPATDETAPATFSNYGKKTVDVFAPGVSIYSTVPENTYEFLQGTSMAAPTVAGVAAIIRSHFPNLTAAQVREIIMKSVIPVEGEVIKPGSKEKVTFKDLCVTGGYVSAYEAVKLASQTKGKKK
ncbi:MAG: S8 family peptidase [Schleiferiaceae bacterium]|nr:S8 family peptidase [Schleiferiaceae bacterium]